MAKGSSGIGGGSKAAGGGGALSAVNKAIDQAIGNPQPVAYEDVVDIQNNRYGLDTSRLSDAERKSLAQIIYSEVMGDGATAKNSMKTVDDINKGKVAQINISQLDMDDLATVARLSAKIGSTAAGFCIDDALKLISYSQTTAMPFS